MKEVSLYTMQDNILRVYYDATRAERDQGHRWYFDAHNTVDSMALDTGVTLEQAAAVVSILSPLVRWERNVEAAETLIIAWKMGEGPDIRVDGFKANRLKAYWMLEEDSTPSSMFGKRAPKTGAFYRLLVDPWISDDVVIDGHAYGIAIGVREPIHSQDIPNLEYRGRYDRISEAYRMAARKVGISPQQMQATTWVVWRNRHGV